VTNANAARAVSMSYVMVRELIDLRRIWLRFAGESEFVCNK
jgi:hypothetical protein